MDLFVEIDQPIYELETDKITQEGLAESNGVISLLVKEGEEVEIGSTIAQIDDTQEEKKSRKRRMNTNLRTLIILKLSKTFLSLLLLNSSRKVHLYLKKQLPNLNP